MQLFFSKSYRGILCNEAKLGLFFEDGLNWQFIWTPEDLSIIVNFDWTVDYW